MVEIIAVFIHNGHQQQPSPGETAALISASRSLNGVDQAITSLNYKLNSIKHRVITAIRSHYTDDASLAALTSIATDELIQSIWDTGTDLEKIKRKRRNFSSVRSSINGDLKRLSPEDENPENLTITDQNIFDMTDEAKNSLLSSFTDAISTGDLDINQVTDILKMVTEFLADVEKDSTEDTDPLDIIKHIKAILTKAANGDLKGLEVEEIEDDLEAIELDEEEEIEEVEDDLEDLELDEEEEIEEVEDDLEAIELDEEEEIEEVDDDIEAIELEEDEEVEEIDDDLEAIELDEEEEIEEVEDDLEDLELDEEEEIEEVEDDLEDLELDEEEEIEEVEDDLEAIELDEEEEIEEVEDDLEDLELTEDEEIEEVEEVEEVEDEMDTLELDEEEEIQEVDDDMESLELAEDEEIEEVDDDMETLEVDENAELIKVNRLTEEEFQALEEFKKKKELAENFDNALGDRDKKYNAYVRIPEGTYTVGARQSTRKTLDLQQLKMPKAYIAKYPVTNSLFEVFVEQTGYVTTAEKKGEGTVFQGRFKKSKGSALWKKSAGSTLMKGACWYQPHGPGSSLHGKRNHPVVQISIADANVFSSWIGRRLPSEAEWEAAARTDMGFKYPWGNQWQENACNIEKSSVADTTPVDHYEDHANEFRIVDLLGNAMEWVSDQEEVIVDGKAPALFNIAKGGGWIARQDVTVTSRALFRPGFTSNTIGFRCISKIDL
jgi:formylglycine-generating enzyme required for sulfatase activity